MTEFAPSKYQQAIFDWITTGRGNALVQAVAGSGKTTTIVQAAKLLSGTGLFVAFSKEIQLELEKRLRGTRMVCKTVHSIGFGAVRNYLQARGVRPADPSAGNYKYRDLARKWVEDNGDLFIDYIDDDEYGEFPDMLTKLTHYARVSLTNSRDMDALDKMAQKFSVNVHAPELYRGVRPVLEQGVRLAETKGQMDFTDMIWLPWVLQLPIPNYGWVFCDECQDLSAAQLDIVLKSSDKRGGRMLFVGDSRQAIFGFAGADCESFWNIQKATEAVILPLSVNYRCPSSHLDLVRGIVPQIEARAGAPAGTITTIADDKVADVVREGDMILSRKTAPLLDLCIKLIAARVPARVRGRDIGKELSKIAAKVAAKCKHGLGDFADQLDNYLTKEESRLMARNGNEEKLQSLYDKVNCVNVIFETYKGDDIAGMLAEIDALFVDGRASVTLCTVHRAKGLENERIFILNPDDLPLKWKGQQPWQLEQEMNLRYVALTRAKSELFFVSKTLPPAAKPAAQPAPNSLIVYQQVSTVVSRRQRALVASIGHVLPSGAPILLGAPSCPIQLDVTLMINDERKAA